MKIWRDVLLMAFCIFYAYTGFSYYERCILPKLEEMKLVAVYLAILSRIALAFALFLIFINYELISIMKKKWPKVIFLLPIIVLLFCVIYIIYRDWDNCIFGSPQNLSEIIHNEILSPIVIFLYSLIFLCVICFRIAFHYFGGVVWQDIAKILECVYIPPEPIIDHTAYFVSVPDKREGYVLSGILNSTKSIYSNLCQ